MELQLVMCPEIDCIGYKLFESEGVAYIIADSAIRGVTIVSKTSKNMQHSLLKPYSSLRGMILYFILEKYASSTSSYQHPILKRWGEYIANNWGKMIPDEIVEIICNDFVEATDFIKEVAEEVK